MLSIATYAVAALAEIAGCFAFWAWFRMDRSPFWLVPGVLSPMLFAYLLTRVDSAAAGRAYAAYGGMYIAMAVLWLWCAEDVRPDRWDIAGMMLCLLDTAMIFFGPHRT